MTNFTHIIREQQQELLDKLGREVLIQRSASPQAQPLLNSSQIKVITGIRRCGKSIFSAQLLAGKKYGYINFDDEKLSDLRVQELDEILKAVYEVYGRIDFLFLDEIQNITSWELFANRLQRQGLNLVITGSNAKLLSKELATHLTGRHIAIELFPFSFEEFLCYKKIELRGETTKTVGLIKGALRSYVEVGGFPEALKEPDPFLYVKSVYSTILLKDILLRHKIRYTRTFRELAGYVLTNFACEVSFNKLKNIFKLGSDHTTKNYLGFLEESYLMFLIEKFSYKKKESVIENRKVYVIDTGLIKAVSFRFQEDFSHLYENVVAVELLRRKAQDPQQEVYYWKNSLQEEVDFIVKEGIKITQLIQVCCDLSSIKTKEREFRALLKASKELHCQNLLVITSDEEGEETLNWFGTTRKIRCIPLWKWLLGKQ